MLRFRPGGVAQAQTKPAFTPTKRGGGGPVKVLWWQAPTLLNPHFANGTKDQDGSRIFYEPLASYDPDGNLVAGPRGRDPDRAERRPRQGRHDRDLEAQEERPAGTTASRSRADDVVFNWEYATDPAHRRRDVGLLPRVTRIERSTPHRQVTFNRPQPFWADAFCGNRGMIIPKHVFEHVQGRQVARGAGEPEARRHRRRTSSSTSSRATSCRPSPTRTTTCRTGRSSTRSR